DGARRPRGKCAPTFKAWCKRYGPAPRHFFITTMPEQEIPPTHGIASGPSLTKSANRQPPSGKRKSKLKLNRAVGLWIATVSAASSRRPADWRGTQDDS